MSGGLQGSLMLCTYSIAAQLGAVLKLYRGAPADAAIMQSQQ
jgi:hypothetical protein